MNEPYDDRVLRQPPEQPNGWLSLIAWAVVVVLFIMAVKYF